MNVVEIEKYLQKVIGQQVIFIGFDKDMLIIEFGDYVDMQTEDEHFQKKARYNLHVTSTYRILTDDEKQVFLGDLDIYTPSEKYKDREDFDWQRWETTLFGERIRTWMVGRKFYVKSAFVNPLGDLRMYFTNGYILEVYADTVAPDRECWCFFDRNESRKFVIVYGNKIEWIETKD